MKQRWLCRFVLGVFVVVVGALAAPGAGFAQTLATYQFSRAGWTTFGLALPQGAATGAVKLGGLSTQTDVKRTWPDGSIRHAIVSAKVSGAGPLAITPGTPAVGVYNPTWPSAAVTFTIAGVQYVANLGSYDGAYPWLTGPVVNETRRQVAPVGPGGAHPFLRVVFDVRSYNDGAHRIDIAVNNVLNVAATDTVTYDVAVSLGGTTRYSRSALSHGSFRRWRHTLWTTGASEASYVPDLVPFFNSRALARFLSTVSSNGMPYATSGSGFGPLGAGHPDNEYVADRRPTQNLAFGRTGSAQLVAFNTESLLDVVKFCTAAIPSGFSPITSLEPRLSERGFARR